MAASGFTPISLYYSTTASAVPTSGNLANGELGLNIADMKLYAKNSAGTVTLLASNAGASGSVTSVSGTGTVNGLTLTGTVTTSGSLTLGGTLSLVSPPPIGSTTPNTGAFTTLSATGTIASTQSGAFLTATPATATSAGYMVTVNTGGAYYIGVNNSDGTTLGGTAYSLNLTAPASRVIENFIGGTKVLAISSTGLAVTGAISATTTIRTSDGVVGTPTFSFTNETSTGLYRSNNGAMSVAILGSEIARFTANGLLLNSNSNTVASVIAGGLNSNNGIIQLGSSGTAYQILGGDYQGNLLLYTGVGGGPIIQTVGNTERFRVASAGQIGLSGANYGTAGQVLTSGGPSGQPTWAAAGGGSQAFVAFGSTGRF